MKEKLDEQPVYCSECKHLFQRKELSVRDRLLECHATKNVFNRWLSPISRWADPDELNKDNNCSFYEQGPNNYDLEPNNQLLKSRE